MLADSPELSIVIPTLNEASAIVSLIENLCEQKKSPSFEVIVVDGGSQDATLAQVNALSELCLKSVLVIDSLPGRAKQMNAGAQVASGQMLLFLHADTLIEDPYLLKQANEEIKLAYDELGHERVAGHFGLYFIRQGSGYERAYYFYECKTRLNRPGCINGDQGMWLSRTFFEELGGFDESLGFMEDARISARIFQRGQWVSFSNSIFTSARRFEVEGLKARQTLNALLCAMDAIALDYFFEQARQAYKAQTTTQQLDLQPFLVKIHQASWAKGISQGLKWWWRTGGFVAENAWQLAFALDCRDSFAKGLSVADVESLRLQRYERYLRSFIESVVGRFLTMLVTFSWFYTKLLLGRIKKS